MAARSRVLAVLILIAAFPALLGAQSVAGLPRDRDFDETSEPGAGIAIVANVRRATVSLNGTAIGTTPLSKEDIDPGFYLLRVEKEGYEPFQRSITLEPGLKLLLTVYLSPASGFLFIDPSTEGILVTVDGAPTSPGMIRLPVGSHSVTVARFGFETIVATVPVVRGAIYTLPLEFLPIEAKLVALKLHRKTINPLGREGFDRLAFTLVATGPLEVGLEVLDGAGARVYARPLGLLERYETLCGFDGRDAAGEVLADGSYTIVVTDASGRFTLRDDFRVDAELAILPLGVEGGLPGPARAGSPFVMPEGSFVLDAGLGFRVGGAGVPLDARVGLAFAPTGDSEYGLLYEGNSDGSWSYLWDLWVGGRFVVVDLGIIKAALECSILAFTTRDGEELVVLLPEGSLGISLGIGTDAVGISASAKARFSTAIGADLVFEGGAAAWIAFEGFKLGLSGSLGIGVPSFVLAWPVGASLEISIPSGILSWRFRADLAIGPSTGFIPAFEGISAGASLVF